MVKTRRIGTCDQKDQRRQLNMVSRDKSNFTWCYKKNFPFIKIPGILKKNLKNKETPPKKNKNKIPGTLYIYKLVKYLDHKDL